MMVRENRLAAFLASLLPVIGWVYVLLFHRHDKLAVFHTRQSMAIVGMAVAAFVLWLIAGWLIAMIPLAGPLLAIVSFSLVFVLYLGLIIVWIIGMVRAWQAQQQPLPLVGRWAARLPLGG
jgi:uncharacterized membrane protein